MAVLCIFLAAACGYDYQKHRIPNYLTAAMAVWGGVWRLGEGGPAGMLSCLGAALLAAAMVYPFFKIGAVGGGDVKLFGATAVCLPPDKILVFLFLSLLVAAIFSLLKMWKENSFARRLRHLRRYLAETAVSGRWKMYTENEEDKPAGGVCLSGPVLASVLLYLGGVY